MVNTKQASDVVGEGKMPCLLLCLNSDYVRSLFARDAATARHEAVKHTLFYKTSYESCDGGIRGCDTFKPVNALITLDRQDETLYAIPIYMCDTSRRVSCIEVYDSSLDVSNFVIQKHAEYVNPYRVGVRKETVLSLQVANECNGDQQDVHMNEDSYDDDDEDDDDDKDQEDEHVQIGDDILALLQSKLTTNKRYKTPRLTTIVDSLVEEPPNPRLLPELAYRQYHHVYVPTEDTLIVAGLFWWDKAHWTLCNSGAFITPSPVDVLRVCNALCLYTKICFLQTIYLTALSTSTMRLVPLPSDIPHDITFPTMFCKVGVNSDTMCTFLNQLKDTLFVALLESVFNNPKSEITTSNVDYEQSCTIVQGTHMRRKMCSVQDAFSPVHNSFVRRRWGLDDYVTYLRRLSGNYYDDDEEGDVSKGPRKWCAFAINKGQITSVLHADGSIYGTSLYPTESLSSFARQLSKLSDVLNHPSNELHADLQRTATKDVVYSTVKTMYKMSVNMGACVCYIDTNNGQLYVTHPLFPTGKAYALQPTRHMTDDELLYYNNAIQPAIADEFASFSLIE